jgi:four helix bundle protein
LKPPFSIDASSKAEALKARCTQFAVRVVRLFRYLKQSEEGRIIGKQVLRSGTSVAANYRAACRARSHAEFISKLGIVAEEMDETIFWLELLIRTGTCRPERLGNLLAESKELMAIFDASVRTAKRNLQ